MRSKLYRGKNVIIKRIKDASSESYLIRVFSRESEDNLLFEFKTKNKPSFMSRNFTNLFKLLDEYSKNSQRFKAIFSIPSFFSKSIVVDKFLRESRVDPKIKFMALIKYFYSKSNLSLDFMTEKGFEKYVKNIEFIWLENEVDLELILTDYNLIRSLSNPVSIYNLQSYTQYRFTDYEEFDFNISGKEKALEYMNVLDFITTKNQSIKFKDFLNGKQTKKSQLKVSKEMESLAFLASSIKKLISYQDYNYIEDLTPKRMLYYLLTEATWINYDVCKKLEPENLDDYYSENHLDHFIQYAPSLAFYSEETCKTIFNEGAVYPLNGDPYLIKTINNFAKLSTPNSMLWLKTCPLLISATLNSSSNDNLNICLDLKDFTNELLKPDNTNTPFIWLLEMQGFRNSRTKELINERLDVILK